MLNKHDVRSKFLSLGRNDGRRQIFALNPFINVPTPLNGITLDIAVAYRFSGNIDVIANLSSLSFSSTGLGWGGDG